MIRTGLNVIPECPIAEVVRVAVAAEALGFDRCWVYDEGLTTRDVYVTMAAVAAATSTLEIGPGITNPYTRHPAQTASAIASLDEMSAGRAFLGLGAGGSLTLDPVAISRRRPLTAVREAIEVARALFSGVAVNYQGDTVQLSAARLEYGRRDIEIWLAGRGPKMLALGGAVADGVMLDFIHKPSLSDYVRQVRASNPAARICYSTAVIPSPEHLEVVRPHMTYRLVDAPDAVKAAIGLSPGDADRIRAAMSDGLHAAAQHVRDDWILPFVISGGPAECAQELALLCETHHLDEFLLPMFEMSDQLGYLGEAAQVLDAVSARS